MKKRDYLSPHTWQQTKMSDLDAANPQKGYSKLMFKSPVKMGRYVALLLLAGLIFFLTFHHAKNESAPLTVATLGPTIQTVTLPTLAHNHPNTISSPQTA